MDNLHEKYILNTSTIVHKNKTEPKILNKFS